MAEEKKTILVLGGSGYLGQFLVSSLAPLHKVAFTFHSTDEPQLPGCPQAFWVNLATGEGLHTVFDTLGPVDVVINCAAVSQPALCDKHPEAARALNVPTQLLEAMDIHRCATDADPLLIFFSTDQVYDGSHANWKEDEACHPVNTYGCTKVEAEKAIQERWPNHVILRSSIIYGPQSHQPVSRSLFLQFMHRVLRMRKPTTFFVDEYRNPIYIHDIIKIVMLLVLHAHDLPTLSAHKVFNMGGPQRFSRAEMALELAAFLHMDPEGIVLSAPASSVHRSTPSPADISMNSSRLIEALGIELTPFSEALSQIPLD
ncbi:hypothetical protein WJX73_007610 [Symbiochloris irregularis]|uniref:RmlD-like substrate binding domain-containing protein n=1 Tax=Symbiochloris irregularis TaxID=706552 RepID=A0AAW1NLM4_9CHLO